ncbi:MAG: hypothetical protein KF805_01835 [Phycisphaeraceae bacterium]|nr:hypothetical protein [Phycisphaeraceae bacterium]
MTPPPLRKRPLELEYDLIPKLATKADLLLFCYQLVNMPSITAVNMDDARGILIQTFRDNVVLTGPEQVVLNGGSIPTYRKLPDGSHWTEDWLQIENGQGVATPWVVDLPTVNPTHRLYPCLRVLFSAPF